MATLDDSETVDLFTAEKNDLLFEEARNTHKRGGLAFLLVVQAEQRLHH